MERVIETVKLQYSNVMELQGAITKLIASARMASNGQAWGGGTTVHLQDEDGFSVTHVELVEETMSDGTSKVYDVRLFFAVPDFSKPSGLAEEPAYPGGTIGGVPKFNAENGKHVKASNRRRKQ